MLIHPSCHNLNRNLVFLCSACFCAMQLFSPLVHGHLVDNHDLFSVSKVGLVKLHTSRMCKLIQRKHLLNQCKQSNPGLAPFSPSSSKENCPRRRIHTTSVHRTVTEMEACLVVEHKNFKATAECLLVMNLKVALGSPSRFNGQISNIILPKRVFERHFHLNASSLTSPFYALLQVSTMMSYR